MKRQCVVGQKLESDSETRWLWRDEDAFCSRAAQIKEFRGKFWQVWSRTESRMKEWREIQSFQLVPDAKHWNGIERMDFSHADKSRFCGDMSLSIWRLPVRFPISEGILHHLEGGFITSELGSWSGWSCSLMTALLFFPSKYSIVWQICFLSSLWRKWFSRTDVGSPGDSLLVVERSCGTVWVEDVDGTLVPLNRH